MTPLPELIPLDAATTPGAAGDRVGRALAEGRVVAIPTETVYGLAVRGDSPEAVAALRALKGKDASAPLTWHVSGAAALEAFPGPSPMARRLAERYWPGPLTLVLPGTPAGLEHVAQDDWTGVRAPALPELARLFDALPFPVVASSANASGEPPIQDPGAIASAFEDRIACVVDGGPPRLGESSVVLRLGRGRFEVLREGILDLDKLREAAGLAIGFVCTGNTCRSPMAEGLARVMIAERLGVDPERIGEFGFDVRSMGVFAGPGAPPSPHAVEVLADRGIDISGHASSSATPAAIERLDRVYALTASHLQSLDMSLPPGRAEGFELLDPDGRDVPDPIGGSRADYERTAEHIRAAIERRLDDWV